MAENKDIKSVLPILEGLPRNGVLLIGNFDGIHAGHRKLIAQGKQIASDERALISLSFWPHPREVLQGKQNLRLLSRTEQVALLHQAGVDAVVQCPFTEDLYTLTAAEFLSKIVRDKMGVKDIVVGKNHQLGSDRVHSGTDLQTLAASLNLNVHEVELLEGVSSTRIREALTSGDLDAANEMLGYNYPISGIVVEGQQIGRTIGYPTANIAVQSSSKCIPQEGAYAVQCYLGDSVEAISKRIEHIGKGMLYIGRGGLGGNDKLRIETHILDYNPPADQNLYGQWLTVFLEKKLRPNKTFSTVQELKQQLDIDIEQIRAN